MKKIVSAAILLIIFNFSCLYLIYDINLSLNEEVSIQTKEEEEEKIIPHVLDDNTIYKSLSIDNVSISDKNNKVNIEWFYNSSDKEYYIYLPSSFDRNRLNVSFDIDHETIISAYDEDGNLVCESYNEEVSNIFKNDRVILKLETNVEKIMEYHVNIYSSSIPTLFIDVDGGDKAFNQIISSSNHSVSKTGKFILFDTDGTVIESDMKKFKGRGNATWTRPKKPFAIKLKEDKEILGMKESNDWLLITNYADGSLSRNSIFMDFARDLGLSYTPEYRPVDVFINDKYYGSYILTSKVECNEERIDNNDEYLFEIENHPEGDEIKLKSGNIISIKNPDLASLSFKEKNRVKNDLKNKLDKIESLISNSRTTKEELEKYIDLESFAKYYWVQEISLNFDVQRGSNYFYYKDGIIYAGPVWDMDNTLNRSYIYANNTGYFTLDNYSLSKRINNNWYRGLFNKTYFQELADEIFINNIDLIGDLVNRLDNYYSLIDLSARMNYIRWPYSKMMIQDPRHPWRKDDNSYEDSKRILKEDLSTRIKWYKEQYYLYDKFEYEITGSNKKDISGTFSKNRTLKLDEDYKGSKVKIYGISANENKEFLKEVELSSDNNEIDVTLSKKIASKYKKINTSKYHFTIDLK